jgi:type IX secretion system PorP/SprF family membrane protein
MIRFFVVLIFLFTAYRGSAQYFQFSQYNYASQRVSPTAPATSDYARLGFLYRNQGTGGDINLNSNLLSASYPLINKKTGKRWSGAGITLMDDRSGGLYSVTEGSLSYAVNVFLTELQSVSLGVRGLYQQRKIDLSGLHTGLQFIPDRGFDESLSSGENLGTFKSDFVTFSTGLSWQQLDKDGIRIGYWSFSLFDFNKPQESFLDNYDSRRSATVVGGGGFRA